MKIMLPADFVVSIWCPDCVVRERFEVTGETIQTSIKPSAWHEFSPNCCIDSRLARDARRNSLTDPAADNITLTVTDSCSGSEIKEPVPPLG